MSLDISGCKLALRRQLLSWYHDNDRPLPWRLLWKQQQNPYHVWLSEIMLQQTVIKAVIPAYHRFLAMFPTVQELAVAPEDALRRAAKGLGYYRRFGFLQKAAQKLVSIAGQSQPIQWPTTYEEWLELPGIGPYTAAAITSIAFNVPKAVVDGNVERVFCRLMDIRQPPNLPALKKPFLALAQELLEKKQPGDFNQAMMELGQLVCTKSSPSCASCPIQKHCQAFARGSQHLAPANKERMAKQDVQLRMIVAVHRDKIGLMARPATAKFLKGAMGLPTLILEKDGGLHGDGFEAPRWVAKKILGTTRHSITKHRLAIEVEWVEMTKPLDWQWFAPDEVEHHLTASLDQKAWKVFLNAQAKKDRWGQRSLFEGSVSI